MTDPERVGRRWLALALAPLWAVSGGLAAAATLPASSLAHLPEAHIARRRKLRWPASLLPARRVGPAERRAGRAATAARALPAGAQGEQPAGPARCTGHGIGEASSVRTWQVMT